MRLNWAAFWFGAWLTAAGLLSLYVWRHYMDPVGVALDYFETHK